METQFALVSQPADAVVQTQAVVQAADMARMRAIQQTKTLHAVGFGLLAFGIATFILYIVLKVRESRQ